MSTLFGKPLRRSLLVAVALGVGVVGTAGAAGATPGTQNHAARAATSWTAGLRAYFVITAPGDTAGAKTAIATNGGTVFAAYDSIGVLVAHSSSATFAATIRAVTGVQQVGATRTSDVPADAYNPAVPASPAQTVSSVAETVRSDMSQIKADQAWAVNPGSSSVTVGILDTGVDDQHADLKPNFDATNSVSCAYGKADTQVGAWRPVGDHGTHVAGSIAAAKNGKGIVGVAPGVKIASVRVAEPNTSLFFPENVVCGFTWSGDKGFKVTNNSYYIDPWWFNCPDNLDQAAIIEGVKRAAAYAEGKGVLNVAAAGNDNYDLAHKTTDTTSPDDSTKTTRTVTNSCLDLPAELPGVVAVSAVGAQSKKASYSNYGTGKISVTAPGGDSAQDSGVYSTLPGGGYGYKNGTSMATPHVAGVAALLASANPTDSPATLRSKLGAQAADLACPSDTRCTGTTAVNSFFGEGQVDALKAVGGTTPPGTYFETLTDATINDNATVDSPITVSGVTGNAPATLKVGVDIKHTYRGDLVVSLVAPDGTVYLLEDFVNSDSTANVFKTYTVNASSEAANGVWKLRVQDVAAQDVGKIDAWNLTF